MTLSLYTAPTSEPVTAAEVKLDARLSGTAFDSTIETLITAARMEAEAETGRALMPQTWELVLDAFPSESLAIEVGKLPISTITHVKYYDTSGVLQTLAADQYTLDGNKLPGWIYLAPDCLWPSTQCRENAVQIRFVAGYANAAAVPAPIKYWIRAKVVPEVDMTKEQSTVTDFVNRMLDPYRLYHV
jgi:uncharacterized phiE125 gp8 family phage protein